MREAAKEVYWDLNYGSYRIDCGVVVVLFVRLFLRVNLKRLAYDKKP